MTLVWCYIHPEHACILQCSISFLYDLNRNWTKGCSVKNIYVVVHDMPITFDLSHSLSMIRQYNSVPNESFQMDITMQLYYSYIIIATSCTVYIQASHSLCELAIALDANICSLVCASIKDTFIIEYKS